MKPDLQSETTSKCLPNAQSRDEFLRRLRNNNHYLATAAQHLAQSHADRWAALRASAEVPDPKRQSFNAARDNRLALVVAVFEAFNLHKAGVKAAESPDNEKAQVQLKAARYAITAAALDVMSNFVKGVGQAGDRGGVSYQLLKGMGGGFSAVASGYGAVLDYQISEK